MKPLNVLVAVTISNTLKNYLIQHNCNIIEYQNGLQIFSDIDGIITSNKLKIDKYFIDNAPNLKWIARLGSGLEIIDINYAKEKNIFVCSSPAGIANAVAEHTTALIINLQKNIFTSANQVQQMIWSREPNRGWELEGKTVCIIGFGNTGKALANKLSVFGCTILAYDKYNKVNHPNAITSSIENIYANADIVSYNVPLTTETTNYYQTKLFAKKHILINTSRGEVAPTIEIIKGLQSGQLINAGLDVLDFENELPFNTIHQNYINELLKYNCIITPHIAGYSFNAIEKMSYEIQNQLIKGNIL